MSESTSITQGDASSVTPDFLGELHEALAQAADEKELLAVVAHYTASYKPQSLRLFYVISDSAQQPQESEMIGVWPPDPAAQQNVPRQRFAVKDFAIAQQALSRPGEIYVCPDLLASPMLNEKEKQHGAAAQMAAFVILPCYLHRSRSWQGILSISWPVPHTPDAAELATYRAIARLLPAFIAHRRTLEAHRETLRELQQIHDVTTRLNATLTIDQALQVVVAPFIALGAASALWSTLHCNADGTPDAVDVLASWMRPPSNLPSLVGQRMSILASPLSQLWLARPEEPLLISDVYTDERIDPHTRELLTGRRRAALIILPMRTRGRWVGILTIVWNEKQAFSDADAALCRTLISHAAIVFDNVQLMERMQIAVRDHQRQTLALKALLDNMPVGVVVMDVDGREPHIINPKALEIINPHNGPLQSRADFGRDYKRYAARDGRQLSFDEIPLGRTLADGKSYHEEIDVIRDDGSKVNLDAFSAPIPDEHGKLRAAISLFVDVSERKHVEAERARMQEELIAFQAAALAERSTPLIPISDEIIVLPLIGSLDPERGQRLLDVLLHGVSQARTRVVIIDVTGVRTLDTQAGRMLTQAAQALRLLGVEPVLTGIRAEVAQTLVGLGVPLDRIATRSTVQSGLAYANAAANRSKRRDAT